MLIYILLLVTNVAAFQFASRLVSISGKTLTAIEQAALVGAPGVADSIEVAAMADVTVEFARAVCAQSVLVYLLHFGERQIVNKVSTATGDVLFNRGSARAPQLELNVDYNEMTVFKKTNQLKISIGERTDVLAVAVLGAENDALCGGTGAWAPYATNVSFFDTTYYSANTTLWSYLPRGIYMASTKAGENPLLIVRMFRDCRLPGQLCGHSLGTMWVLVGMISGNSSFCRATARPELGGLLFQSETVNGTSRYNQLQFTAFCALVPHDQWKSDMGRFDIASQSLFDVVVARFPPPDGQLFANFSMMPIVLSPIRLSACTAMDNTSCSGNGVSLLNSRIIDDYYTDGVARETSFPECGCICETVFAGARCERCNAELLCSGRGMCNNVDKATSTAQCLCNDDFFGATCDVSCNGNTTCNGHGTCSSDAGVCLCDNSFVGRNCRCMANDTACETAISQLCVSNCTGHGTCLAIGVAGQCECRRGFWGAACERESIEAAPFRWSPITVHALRADLTTLPWSADCATTSPVVVPVRALRATTKANVLALTNNALYVLDGTTLERLQTIELEASEELAAAVNGAALSRNDFMQSQVPLIVDFLLDDVADVPFLFIWSRTPRNIHTTMRVFRLPAPNATAQVAVPIAKFSGLSVNSSLERMYSVQPFTTGPMAGRVVVLFQDLIAVLELPSLRVLHQQSIGKDGLQSGGRFSTMAILPMEETGAFSVYTFERDFAAIVNVLHSDGSSNATWSHTTWRCDTDVVCMPFRNRSGDWCEVALDTETGEVNIFALPTHQVLERFVAHDPEPESADTLDRSVCFVNRNGTHFVVGNVVTTADVKKMEVKSSLQLLVIDLVAQEMLWREVVVVDTVIFSVTFVETPRVQIVVRSATADFFKMIGRGPDDRDKITVFTLDAALSGIDQTETIDNVLPSANELVLPTGLVVPLATSNDIVLINDCSGGGGAGVDADVVASFVLLGAVVLATVIELWVSYRSKDGRVARIIVTALSVLIIVAEIVMLALSSIALRNALVAIADQTSSNFTIETMAARFLEPNNSQLCEPRAPLDAFCFSCGSRENIARDVYVSETDDYDSMTTFLQHPVSNGRQCHNDRARNLCSNAKPEPCFGLLKRSCDCERSLYATPCECTLDPNDARTCTPKLLETPTPAPFRPEFRAAFDLCRDSYVHIASLLSMVLWTDIVLSLLEIAIDVCLRVGWVFKGAMQRRAEWGARITSIVFFIAFGFMLLVVVLDTPGGLLCDKGGTITNAVPGCRFTKAWFEENDERRLLALVRLAVTIAVPNLVVFLLDSLRFWLTLCSDVLALDEGESAWGKEDTDIALK
jgi:hypothetical protein